jgi:UDP:flavonoid glycosyltransferase YjiC (YdhE family)
MSSSDYDVVWPRSPRTIKINPVAKRLDTLKGKTVAQLWDYIFRGDEIFPILEEELGKRFPDTKFINYTVFGSTHGGDEREVVANIPNKLKQYGADAVISGMGC